MKRIESGIYNQYGNKVADLETRAVYKDLEATVHYECGNEDMNPYNMSKYLREHGCTRVHFEWSETEKGTYTIYWTERSIS